MLLIRSVLTAVVVLFLAAVHTALFADGMIINPAEKFVTSPGGVDLRTGRFVYSQTDIPAPEPAGGLALTRTMPDYVAMHANQFGNFSSNWDIMLLETRTNLYTGEPYGNDYRMNLHLGGRSITFFSNVNAQGYQYQGDGANVTLTYTGGTKASATAIYTFEDTDGSIFTFRPIGNLDCADQVWGSGPRRCAYVSSIVRPDGTKLDFTYAYDASKSGNRARLTQVVSSRGYALLFEGSGTSISKSCLINYSRTALPSGGTCPADAIATVGYGYTASQKLASVTDPLNQTASITYSQSGSTTNMAFIAPGETTPWMVNSYYLRLDEEGANQEITTSQALADGHVYTYTNFFTPTTTSRPTATIMGGAFTDTAGNSGSATFDFPIKSGSRSQFYHCMTRPCPEIMPEDELDWNYQATPGPVSIQDGLGHTTTYDYCDPVAAAGLPSYEPDRCMLVPMNNFTDPEGVRTDIKYDGYRNVTEVRRTPKPGSSLPQIVTAATYDCSSRKFCTKPVSSTDAKGNVSDMVYSPDHGGIISEMQPAPVAGGARPLKLYAYAQRYAWVKDAGGVLMQAASPVWVPIGVTVCQTLAGTSPAAVCDTTAQQLTTTFEYGATGTAEALLIKGEAVTSAGVTLRTCFGYDNAGRRISQTSPNANLATCP